jgi:hypothetical protein
MDYHGNEVINIDLSPFLTQPYLGQISDSKKMYMNKETHIIDRFEFHHVLSTYTARKVDRKEKCSFVFLMKIQ